MLEVILALALSSIVLAVVGTAIQVNLRATDSSRADVVQAQVARVVLKRIADDLRSAVWYQEVDVSALTSSLAAIVQEAADGAGGGGGGGGGEQTDEGQDDQSGGGGDSGGQTAGGQTTGGSSGATAGGSSSGDSSTDTGETTSSIAPPTNPGLYGFADYIEIDTSRLPRIEDYDPWMADLETGWVEPPSDVKTVAYYVATPDNSQGVMSGLGAIEFGLVRRAVDRAANVWAVSSGDVAAFESFGEVLAPEILGIEFAYFDGTQWVTEWDSATLGGLPLAIEAAIYMPAASAGMAGIAVSSTDLYSAWTAGEVERYSTLISLPVATGPATEETTTEETGTTTEGAM